MWRQLDIYQFKTFLHARIPRVECPEHGLLQVKVPWAEAKGRFTLPMERLIIDVLDSTARSWPSSEVFMGTGIESTLRLSSTSSAAAWTSQTGLTPVAHG
uniref:transposase family protein n=1 Tax=Solidesulfovibrio carbinolicus TaxID=296842 RepID=UPI001F490039|nr:hypothetical protein [Solidesulfovibrio carbinolicus]